jgi:micrococcal nuclease
MIVLIQPVLERCEKKPLGQQEKFRGERYSIQVKQVIDGDTLLVSKGIKSFRVRLLGIDAPEVHFNKKAAKDVQRLDVCASWLLVQGRTSKEEMLRLAPQGSTLFLETLSHRRDQYDRLLGTVFTEANENLNLRLVARGYAEPYFQDTSSPYANEIRRAYEKARTNKLGMWREIPRARKECSSSLERGTKH